MTTEAQEQASDIFEMSDEELLNMPVDTVTQNNTESEQTESNTEVEVEQKEDKVETTTVEENNGKVAPTVDESNSQEESSQVEPSPNSKEVSKEDKEPEKETPKTDEPPADFDYKKAYEAVLAPFKANGKMVQVRNVDEAIALMQQGANFTRKMQEIAPHRKLIQMLQNNDLLDEGQLSYAIDLVKKNPDAIKKLVKDSGIDPMDIDINEEVSYKEGSHRVSDAEVRFSTELSDLKSTSEGQATLGVIHQTWDEASKQALFDNSGLITTIHQHRENGMYDRVVNEMEHLKTIGKLDANVPFIQAYKAVGDYLQEQGAFADLASKNSTAPVNTPVATRVVAPKSSVTNGAQASAASPSRAAPRKAEHLVNIFGMSDEDFEKLPVPKVHKE